MTPGNAQTDRILPILAYIQTHLDGDLSLHALSQRAGLTPFHFHRLFRQTIEETLKQYTLRLRLERGAYELKVRDESILTIALNSGFQSHEVFTRAFKRHFGLTPRSYRRVHGQITPDAAQNGRSRRTLNRFTGDYQLSAVRTQKLAALPVAFIRHLGDYIQVDPGLYEELTDWTKQRGFYSGDNLLIGIGHDDPAITPAVKLRFDACIEVQRPFETEGRIGFQETPPGWYAAVTYVGPFGPVLLDAYRALFQAVLQLRGFRLIGLPAMEIYRTTQINPDYELNETDIYLPIEKIGV